ncbi:response regulator [Niabella aquatica]
MVEDGLENNIVFGAVQDNKHFLWFTTMSGIDRYDGKSFVHYNLPNENQEPSFGFKQAINIVKDSEGQLWTSTIQQLYRYNAVLDRFEFVLKYPNGPVITSNIFADDFNGIWIGTNKALFRYDGNKKKLFSVGKTGAEAWAFNEDADKRIWATSSKGIYCFTYNKQLKDYVATEVKMPVKLEPLSTFYDRSDRLWIGTLEKGLLIFDVKNQRFLNTSAINHYIKNTAIRGIVYIDKKKQYVLGTDGEGLLFVSEDLTVAAHETYNPDNPLSISSNSVQRLYKDSFDRLWITTFGGGVSYTSDKLPFKNFTHEINNPNSLHNNMGRSCTEDNQGRIWFGTSKGLSIYNPKTGQWKYHTLDSKGDGANILTLLNTGDGYIWAGTYGDGLKKINTATEKVEHYFAGDGSNLKSSLSTNYVFSLYQDSRKNIWIGGIRGLLSVLNPQLSVINSYPVRDIHTLIEDRNGNMYAGGTSGLTFINTHTNAVTKIDFSEKYQNIQIFALQRDGDKFWMGTRGSGLLLWHPQKGIIKHYLEKEGLPSAIVYGILPDEQNRLWLSTTNGLACFTYSSQSFQNYNWADGLRTSQFNSSAHYKTSKGEMIFGGTNGFVMFNPSQIKEKSYPSRIVFTDFKIANQSVIVGADHSPINEQVDDLSEIKLHHNQNSISFHFVNISPQSADKNTYTWKLKGFDKNWSPPSAIGSANYTNLDPGTYEFSVKALNNPYSNHQRNIRIVIASPLYRTWWAYSLYFILLALLFTALRFYLKALLARKRDKERLQFFVNIAHDLRTPLTLIKSPISSILHKADLSTEDKKSLDIAERNADRLMRLVTQLMDFQKADANKMKIKADRYNIVAVLQHILTYFKPLFEDKKISLSFQPGTAEILVWFDRDKFEKIMYNVISNAIKYSKEQGTVTVHVQADDHYCHIKVIDNGIGIPEKQQKQIFQTYYRADNAINLQETGSGIGLMLTKQLVELHKGTISFLSKMNFGTTFKISFPLSDHFTIKEKISESADPDEGVNGKKSRKGTQLLIVEDNLELQRYLEKELSKFYNVDAAANGKEALKLVKQHSYDLIVSDIMMPEMNGYQLCAFLKNQISTCHIPVILLTAIHDDEYRIEGYTVGADDYVQKPFNMLHLKTRIENLLHNRAIIKNKFFNTFDKNANGAEEDPNFIFISNATQIVTDNIQNPQFSIDMLCNELAVSRSVLFRKLKNISDIAPQDFIKNIRLKIAAELLMSKKYSINEITYMTGFSDSKYFSTSFKKKFKQSPTAFLRDNEQAY